MKHVMVAHLARFNLKGVGMGVGEGEAYGRVQSKGGGVKGKLLPKHSSSPPPPSLSKLQFKIMA